MLLNLKAARVNQNLTQRKAAELLGISEATLFNYEKGKTYPLEPTIQKMEEVYKLSYKDIIFLPRSNG